MAVDGHREDGTPDGCEDAGCVAAVARDDRWIGEFLSVEADGRAHFHHKDVLRARVAADRAAEFADLRDRYASDPGDFVLAWNYLLRHPIFHRPLHRASAHTAADLTAEELAAPEHLEDIDGLRDLRMYVDRAEDGTITVSLEHGPHLWPAGLPVEQLRFTPAAGMSSHDPALDVDAPTYEHAIVALAAKVRHHYGDDRSRI